MILEHFNCFVAARCIINVLYVILYHMRLSIYLKENAAQKCFYVLSQYYKAPGGWCSIASDLRLPYKKGVLSWIIRINLLQMCFRKNNDNLYSNIKTIDGMLGIHFFFTFCQIIDHVNKIFFGIQYLLGLPFNVYRRIYLMLMRHYITHFEGNRIR